MKQKPFIKVKAPPYYIALGIKKVESSIKILCGSKKEEEMLATLDTCIEFYTTLFKQGKVTQELERGLIDKCIFKPSNITPGKIFNEKIGVYKTLTLLIELACYYGVMSTEFYEDGNLEQADHYLIKAGEVHGMIYGLHREKRTAKQALIQTSKKVEESWGLRNQMITTKVAKRKSQKANTIKSAEYSKRVEFAKQKWIELPAWHSKPAGSTADKLIKEFGKSVPAKDKLARLISDWKQQLKK
jgi:hypothetical protein